MSHNMEKLIIAYADNEGSDQFAPVDWSGFLIHKMELYITVGI